LIRSRQEATYATDPASGLIGHELLPFPLSSSGLRRNFFFESPQTVFKIRSDGPRLGSSVVQLECRQGSNHNGVRGDGVALSVLQILRELSGSQMGGGSAARCHLPEDMRCIVESSLSAIQSSKIHIRRPQGGRGKLTCQALLIQRNSVGGVATFGCHPPERQEIRRVYTVSARLIMRKVCHLAKMEREGGQRGDVAAVVFEDRGK